MYIPKHFSIDDKSEIRSFIESNAFGQLISTVNGRLFSSHLPFLFDFDKSKAYAHLARQNQQHTNIQDQEIMISLQGPHTYISPSWYLSPGVPTWNYQAVHIYGKAACFDDQDKLQWLVESLTHQYEQHFASPWQPEYRKEMLNAIVGIEIEITEIQCKFKMSQNRSEADRQSVSEALRQAGQPPLAL